MNRRNVSFALVAAISLILDQATKQWIFGNLQQDVDEIQVIPGLFSLVHRQNPGAAFGMFREFEYRHYIFLVFTLIATGFIVDMLRKAKESDALLGGILGLILSGAFGNAIDRVMKQTVTDFLKVYTDTEPLRGWLIGAVGTNEWPSFNVADSALVVGVIAYVVYDSVVLRKQAARPNAAAPSAAGEQHG